jgi:hypothetical protein
LLLLVVVQVEIILVVVVALVDYFPITQIFLHH